MDLEKFERIEKEQEKLKAKRTKKKEKEVASIKDEVVDVVSKKQKTKSKKEKLITKNIEADRLTAIENGKDSARWFLHSDRILRSIFTKSFSVLEKLDNRAQKSVCSLYFALTQGSKSTRAIVVSNDQLNQFFLCAAAVDKMLQLELNSNLVLHTNQEETPLASADNYHLVVVEVENDTLELMSEASLPNMPNIYFSFRKNISKLGRVIPPFDIDHNVIIEWFEDNWGMIVTVVSSACNLISQWLLRHKNS